MTKLERLRAVCTSDPDNAFAWYSLAMELKKTDLAEALAVFERVHGEHPEYLANYYHFAQTLTASAPERAAEIYRQGIAVARTQNNLHALGELEAALASL